MKPLRFEPEGLRVVRICGEAGDVVECSARCPFVNGPVSLVRCRLNSFSFRRFSAAILSVALFAVVACGGSGDEGSELAQVVASDAVLNVDQFTDVGLKRSKEYDVTELPGADSAFYGFWTPPGGESLDFELRFYPSHEAAVSDGTALAEEVTGPDAAVTEAASTWKVGVSDRRTSGFTITGGGGSLAVKYADYMIYGNVILLCQGRDSEQSLERCDQLVKAVVGE